MGRALKKVFRGEMLIEDTVELAKEEIARYFSKEQELPIEEETDTGFFGDVIGNCPLCSSPVKRGKFGYGCTNYKNGCKFLIRAYICDRAVSVGNAKLLLEKGKSSRIKGFMSKKGTAFDAFLKIEDGRCVFDFSSKQ